MSEKPNFHTSEYQIFLNEYAELPLEALLSILRGNYNSILNLEHPNTFDIKRFGHEFIQNERRNYQQRVHFFVRLIKERTGYQLKRHEIHTLRYLDSAEPKPELSDDRKENFRQQVREASQIKDRLMSLEKEGK